MKLKSAKLKPGRFYGSYYIRGGATHDKWGNTKNSPLTLRNVHGGVVLDSRGRVIGQEKNLQHHYRSDPRPKRGLRGFSSDRQRKAVMARLRGRR